MITLEHARTIGHILSVNFKVISIHTLKKGMNVELEHGIDNVKTNVTNDDLIMTAKIALAHLAEYPDYYERLEKMERNAEKYWDGKRKPHIFKYN